MDRQHREGCYRQGLDHLRDHIEIHQLDGGLVEQLEDPGREEAGVLVMVPEGHHELLVLGLGLGDQIGLDRTGEQPEQLRDAVCVIATAAQHLPHHHAVDRVDDVGGEGFALRDRPVDLGGHVVDLAEEAGPLDAIVDHLDLDMEVVRQHPVMAHRLGIPLIEQELIELPDPSGFLLHGLEEDFEQLALAVDALGLAGGAIERGHHALLRVLPLDVSQADILVGCPLSDQLVDVGVEVLALAGVDHVAEPGRFLAADQDGEKLCARGGGIETDRIGNRLAAGGLDPGPEPGEEHGWLVSILHQRVLAQVLGSDTALDEGGEGAQLGFVVVEPLDPDIPILLVETEGTGHVDLQIFQRGEGLHGRFSV